MKHTAIADNFSDRLFVNPRWNDHTVKSRNKSPEKVNVYGKEYTVYASRFARNKGAVIVSDNMTGKMAGFPSISTNCLCNPFCRARIEKASLESICAHCFAEATINHYEDLNENCKHNFDVLTAEVLPLELLPRFYSDVKQARIESFGDVFNVNQAINYINIAIVNPHVNVTAWSKNPFIWAAAFKRVGKPSNMTFILSSQYLNKCAVIASGIAEYVDIVFTVYSPDYIEKNHININCGARDCATCRACYRPDLNKSGVRFISEKLK